MGAIYLCKPQDLLLYAGKERWFTLIRRTPHDTVQGRLCLAFAWDVTARGLLQLKLAALERVLAQRTEILSMLHPVPADVTTGWSNELLRDAEAEQTVRIKKWAVLVVGFKLNWSEGVLVFSGIEDQRLLVIIPSTVTCLPQIVHSAKPTEVWCGTSNTAKYRNLWHRSRQPRMILLAALLWPRTLGRRSSSSTSVKSIVPTFWFGCWRLEGCDPGKVTVQNTPLCGVATSQLKPLCFSLASQSPLLILQTEVGHPSKK